MSTVNCHVLETVVLRDLGIALQVLETSGTTVHLSVQPAVPTELGEGACDSGAARRMLRSEIRERTHAVADTLNELHQQMEEGHTAGQLEATVCHIYRQLRDLDRSVSGWLADKPPGVPPRAPSDVAMAPWLQPTPTVNSRPATAPEAVDGERSAEFEI